MVLRNEDGQPPYIDFENAESYVFNSYGFTFYGLGELRMDKSIVLDVSRSRGWQFGSAVLGAPSCPF